MFAEYKRDKSLTTYNLSTLYIICLNYIIKFQYTYIHTLINLFAVYNNCNNIAKYKNEQIRVRRRKQVVEIIVFERFSIYSIHSFRF